MLVLATSPRREKTNRRRDVRGRVALRRCTSTTTSAFTKGVRSKESKRLIGEREGHHTGAVDFLQTVYRS